MLGNNKSAVTTAFGEVLRSARKEKKLSQEKLALESNLQRNYISLIELGVNQPTINTIFKLAKALNLKPHDLIIGVEQITKDGDW